MKTKLFSIFSLIIGFFSFSQIIPPVQTKVNFSYDEAGNQIYRGLGAMNRQAQQETITEKKVQEVKKIEETPVQEIASTQSAPVTIDEKAFWNEIRIYPVPVKDNLTIDWTDKVNDLISGIGIYQQSTVHWIFQNTNIPALNKKIYINMTSEYMGVYILTFTLKDGRRFSRNITKF